MRRQFQLSEEDEACLAARSANWEAIIENNTKWVIVPDFAIPEGYNHRSASAAMRISPSYPDDQIDMVYFYPALALMSGRAIRQLTLCQIDGKQYQQWSRHRPAGEWRAGIDN
ncbi:MAG: E2/UBC family protein, partial [Acidobacteriaceae bacterium]